MIVTALIGRNKPARAAAISGAVPEVDRLLVRSVVDSYQIAVAPGSKVGNVEIQRFGWALSDKPPPTRLLVRGQVTQPAELMAPGGVAATGTISADFGLTPSAAEGVRRQRLAEWITHPENPLFARVECRRAGTGLPEAPRGDSKGGDRNNYSDVVCV